MAKLGINLNVANTAAKTATRARKPSLANITKAKTTSAAKQSAKQAVIAAKTSSRVNKIVSKSNARAIRRTKRALNSGYNATKHAIATAGTVGAGMVVTSTPDTNKSSTPIYITDGEVKFENGD